MRTTRILLCILLVAVLPGVWSESVQADPLPLLERPVLDGTPLSSAAPRQFTYFIDGGVGVSLLQRTTPDGVWWQQPFPHSFDLTSLAYKAGLGIQMNAQWSITASYVSLGTAKAVTEAVSDHNYDYGDRRDPRFLITAYDRLQGGQLVATYRWTQWPVQPMLSGGVAGMLHHVVANQAVEFTGVIPMAVVGGGLCWEWLCGEVTYYRGLSAPQYPISTQAIVPWLVLRVPLNTP